MSLFLLNAPPTIIFLTQPERAIPGKIEVITYTIDNKDETGVGLTKKPQKISKHPPIKSRAIKIDNGFLK